MNADDAIREWGRRKLIAKHSDLPDDAHVKVTWEAAHEKRWSTWTDEPALADVHIVGHPRDRYWRTRVDMFEVDLAKVVREIVAIGQESSPYQDEERSGT